MPTTCNYYVTLRCNQRCVFCNVPHSNHGSPEQEPTIKQVEANLSDLRRLGVMFVDVTGGEPLLYRHIVEMLALLKRRRFMTTVTTNGMLYPRYAKELVGKVDALLFSVDSVDPAEHDRIRGVTSFHLVLESLRITRELRQALYISHVVTNESYDRVDEMVRFANDQKAILYLNPCFSFFGNPGLDPQKAEGLKAYFGAKNVIVDRAQLRLMTEGGNHTKSPVCRAVSSTVVISPDNKLLLPCFHFKKQEIPIENNLYELHARSRVVQRAKELEGRQSFCEGCTVYCYMRSSLYRRYPLDTLAMGAHYLRERGRQRLRRLFLRPSQVESMSLSSRETADSPPASSARESLRHVADYAAFSPTGDLSAAQVVPSSATRSPNERQTSVSGFAPRSDQNGGPSKRKRHLPVIS